MTMTTASLNGRAHTGGVTDDAEVELDKLRRQNERLTAELRKTQTTLEITGKVHALLEQLSESAAPETKSKP